EKLDAIASLWSDQPGPCDRLSRILGVGIPKNESHEEAQARRESAAKVAALVLANALIFQEQLSGSDGRVSTLRSLQRSDDVVKATEEHWRWIWEEINYVPIFQMGEKILLELPSS